MSMQLSSHKQQVSDTNKKRENNTNKDAGDVLESVKHKLKKHTQSTEDETEQKIKRNNNNKC